MPTDKQVPALKPATSSERLQAPEPPHPPAGVQEILQLHQRYADVLANLAPYLSQNTHLQVSYLCGGQHLNDP